VSAALVYRSRAERLAAALGFVVRVSDASIHVTDRGATVHFTANTAAAWALLAETCEREAHRVVGPTAATAERCRGARYGVADAVAAVARARATLAEREAEASAAAEDASAAEESAAHVRATLPDDATRAVFDALCEVTL
jgi:hypothetical protein